MKEQRLFSIEGIRFNRNEIDRGIVLKRPEDRHYASIKDENGVKLSEDSPHKAWKARFHFVSMHQLEIGGDLYAPKNRERCRHVKNNEARAFGVQQLSRPFSSAGRKRGAEATEEETESRGAKSRRIF